MTRNKKEVASLGDNLVFLHLNGKLQLLLNLCCLTLTLTEVIELSSSDLTFTYHVDVVDLRAVNRKNPLNAYAVRNAADRDRL